MRLLQNGLASTSSSTSPGNSYVPAAAADPAAVVVDCGSAAVVVVVESVAVVGLESVASSGNTRTGPRRQRVSKVRVPAVFAAVDGFDDGDAPKVKENCSRNSP